MTKKHYVLIAGAIKDVYDYQKENDGKGSRAIKQGAIKVTAESIAHALAYDNSQFDRVRFLQACGVIEDTNYLFEKPEQTIKRIRNEIN